MSEVAKALQSLGRRVRELERQESTAVGEEAGTSAYYRPDDSSLRTPGDVGIGGAPSYRLDVHEDTDTYAVRIRNEEGSSDARGMLINAGENADPSAIFINFRSGNNTEFVGAIQGDGVGGVDYISSSDERLKEDITHLTGGLDSVMALRPVSYRGKGTDPNKPKISGFLAQEVMAIIPEAAYYDEENDLYSLSWNKLIPFLWSAIQELNEKVENGNG